MSDAGATETEFFDRAGIKETKIGASKGGASQCRKGPIQGQAEW
jgi:hypothetical protein